MLTFCLLSPISRPTNAKASRAFGLVELMVCISIMALVSTVIMTRQNSFNGAIILRNQAYEIAFAIREAQMLAVSGGGDLTIRRYGVAFDTSTNLSVNQTYRLFGDGLSGGTRNGQFEDVEQMGLLGRLDRRFVISNITIDGNNHTVATVSFRRPNFDADFCPGGTNCVTTNFLGGEMIIAVSLVGSSGSGPGEMRRVVVSSTGQISVE